LEALAQQHPGVKLRKVDIVAWDSEVARQHGIRSLPTLWLYEDGELTAKDRSAVAAKLAALR
jgi:thioredoxin-like negative regulator of GroEL